MRNPPGDVEERETNAVLDEDGEVVHVQHGVAGKDKRRGQDEEDEPRPPPGLRDLCQE